MLGIIFIYFIGKAFYSLAEEHNKGKWLFAILGVVSYYVGTAIGGVFIGLFYAFAIEGNIDNINDVVLGLIAMPVGFLTCWIFYKILQSQWSKEATPISNDEVLDADMINNKPQP